MDCSAGNASNAANELKSRQPSTDEECARKSPECNQREYLLPPNGNSQRVAISPTHREKGPHVPFSGLSLCSATNNGAIYQHTIGGYDATTTLPIIRVRSSHLRTRKLRKRIVFKNGDLNIVQERLSKRRRRYLADIVTTLVDIKWRWTLMVFCLSFVLSWLVFGMIWWLILYAHNDLSPDSDHTPCVTNVADLTGCFLFSLESQHTIGYGYRYITDQCPEGVILLCVQSIVGLVIQALMVSVVFTKLARPKKRAQTLMFSRNAVICQQDGRLCLQFRVGNMRTSSLIDANVRAHIIRKRVSAEGETLQFDMQELNLGVLSAVSSGDDVTAASGGDGSESILFIWPMTIRHVIDHRSPLYNMSAEDLLQKERFEIVVVLEGSTESTAMTTQARSSYIPSEILWGHRLEPVIDFRKETGEYWVDYSKFNTTYEVDTPLCSAQELEMFRRGQEEGGSTTIKQTGGDSGSNAVVNGSVSSLDNFQLLRRQSEFQRNG